MVDLDLQIKSIQDKLQQLLRQQSVLQKENLRLIDDSRLLSEQLHAAWRSKPLDRRRHPRGVLAKLAAWLRLVLGA